MTRFWIAAAALAALAGCQADTTADASGGRAYSAEDRYPTFAHLMRDTDQGLHPLSGAALQVMPQPALERCAETERRVAILSHMTYSIAQDSPDPRKRDMRYAVARAAAERARIRPAPYLKTLSVRLGEEAHREWAEGAQLRIRAELHQRNDAEVLISSLFDDMRMIDDCDRALKG